jgi:hypothetical protein
MFKKMCSKAKCLGLLCSCKDEHEHDDTGESQGPLADRPIELNPQIEAHRRLRQQAMSHSVSNIPHETQPYNDYPPLPPSGNESHTGYTTRVSDASAGDRSLSDYEIASLESTRNSITKMAPPTGEYDSNNQVDYRANNSSQSQSENANEGVEKVSTQDASQNQHSIASSSAKRRRAKVHEENSNYSWETNEPSERASKRSRISGENSTSSELEENRAPSDEQIARYRELGVRYQEWIEDASAPGCRIQPAKLTAAQLFEVPQPWDRDEWQYTERPTILDNADPDSMDLQSSNYRSVTASQWDTSVLEYNFYSHINGLNIILGNNISRENGPFWNEVATALYEIDFPISTLRHIAFCNVVNEETGPYIKYTLYPRHNMLWENARDNPCKKFERGTDSYHEILGTQLGKAAASLVISSFPRGSMMIRRIVTWADVYDVQIRFEIVPLLD